MGTGSEGFHPNFRNYRPPSEPTPRTGSPPRLLKPAGQRTNELLPVPSRSNNPGTDIRPGHGRPEKPKQERQQQARVNLWHRSARPTSPKGLGTGNTILPGPGGVPAVLRAYQQNISHRFHTGWTNVSTRPLPRGPEVPWTGHTTASEASNWTSHWLPEQPRRARRIV